MEQFSIWAEELIPCEEGGVFVRRIDDGERAGGEKAQSKTNPGRN